MTRIKQIEYKIFNCLILNVLNQADAPDDTIRQEDIYRMLHGNKEIFSFDRIP